MGGIYGYRGLAFQTSGSILKAARDGRKGYLLLEEAVQEDPRLYDAHMGFGLFRYLLAKLPKSMRWILTVLGFEGDLEGGLNSLRLAAEKGTYTRTEAKLFLSQFLFMEGRRDTAIRFLNELRTEYPENSLFLVLYASWQHRLHNLDEAMVAAQNAIELNRRKKIKHGEELIYSTLGSIHFSLNEFATASSYYHLYMKMTPNEERTFNLTYYRAGLAAEIAGDRATALRYYARMRPVTDRDRAWETFHYRRGQELLRRPLTEAEILTVRGDNELTRKNYFQALALFEGALANPGASVDARARALYGIQQVLMETGRDTEAVETARRLLALIPTTEDWVLPHSLLKLGQTLLRLGRGTEARAAFERVGEFDDYDFQNRVEAQAEEELRKLNGG